MSNGIKNKDLNFLNLHAHLLLGVKRSSVFRKHQNSSQRAHRNNNTKRRHCQPIMSTHKSCRIQSHCPAASRFNPCTITSELGNIFVYRENRKVQSGQGRRLPMAGGLQTLIQPTSELCHGNQQLCQQQLGFLNREKWAQLCHLGQIILPLRTFRLVNLESILQFQHFY